MHEQAAAVLTALDDKCSLFLEQPVADLPLRSHDGMVQEARDLAAIAPVDQKDAAEKLVNDMLALRQSIAH